MENDKKDMNETNTRGTDWEVVSLTASAYAAAPGPQKFDPDEKHKREEFNKTEQDCTEAMFMSKHFIVPHEEPENLPQQHYSSVIHKEQSLIDEQFIEPHMFSKDKGKIDSVSELFGTGHSLSDHSVEFGDGKKAVDIKTAEQEHALFFTPNYSNFDVEVDKGLPIIHDDISDFAEPTHSSTEKLDHTSWRTDSFQPNEENNNERCDESCEAWWKKRAISVYNHAKGRNTIWSIFVAVAMAGLIVLGQRWRREKSYFQQFKWKFSGADEKMNSSAGPVSRFKVLVGGNHRGGSMHDGLHPAF